MRKKKIAVLAAAAALTLGTVFSSYATSKAIEDAKKKVSSMEEEKKKVESALKELEGKKSDTAAYVKELDRNLSALAGELTKLEGDISRKEEQIEEAKAELETAKVTENRQYEDMKLRIQYMYENGQTGLLESMMQSESIAELLNRAEYASQITSYDRKMLEEYRKTRQEVALKEEALKTEHQELLTLQDSTSDGCDIDRSADLCRSGTSRAWIWGGESIMKKPMWIAGLLVACVILTIVPFIYAPKDAGFGGADDAAGELVGEIDPEYEPWAEPVLERILGGELPGETESLLFCLQAALGSGVICYGFGYLLARKKYSTNDTEERQEN